MLLIFQVRYFPYNIFQVIFHVKYFPCRYYTTHRVLQFRAPLGGHQRAQQDREGGDAHHHARNFEKRTPNTTFTPSTRGVTVDLLFVQFILIQPVFVQS